MVLYASKKVEVSFSPNEFRFVEVTKFKFFLLIFVLVGTFACSYQFFIKGDYDNF